MAGLPCSGYFRDFRNMSKHCHWWVTVGVCMWHHGTVPGSSHLFFQVDLDGSNIITAPFQDRFFSWPWPIGVKYGSNGSLRVANFSCFCVFLNFGCISHFSWCVCVCQARFRVILYIYNTAKRQSRAFFKEITIYSCAETFPGSRAFLQNTRELSWSQLTPAV